MEQWPEQPWEHRALVLIECCAEPMEQCTSWGWDHSSQHVAKLSRLLDCLSMKWKPQFLPCPSALEAVPGVCDLPKDLSSHCSCRWPSHACPGVSLCSPLRGLSSDTLRQGSSIWLQQDPHREGAVPTLTPPLCEPSGSARQHAGAKINTHSSPAQHNSHTRRHVPGLMLWAPGAGGFVLAPVPWVPLTSTSSCPSWTVAEGDKRADGFGPGVLLLVQKSPSCFPAAGYWPHSKKWKSAPGWQHGTQPSLIRNPSFLSGAPKHDGHWNRRVHGLHWLQPWGHLLWIFQHGPQLLQHSSGQWKHLSR